MDLDVELERVIDVSEQTMRIFEVVAAWVLVGLFALGVYDLVREIVVLLLEGKLQNPASVVSLIDSVLLLFIIVEIYQTVVAYSREKSVLRIVIVAGVIAVSRKIISFRPGDHPGVEDFVFAASFALLLLVLVAALYVVRRTEGETTAEA